MEQTKPTTIDEYIKAFPSETQQILRQIREIVLEIAPEAEEGISYGIPTFYLNRTYLIYFAGYKKHVSIYPIEGQVEQIDEALVIYKTSGKGTIQFPLDKPIPFDLVRKLVKFKLKENMDKAEKKIIKKKESRKTDKS